MTRSNPFDKYLTKEDHLHIQVCTYIEMQYRNIFFIHPHNEAKRKPFERYLAKKMRLRTGAPDILIFEPKITRGTDGVHTVVIEYIKYCGLAIEFKIKPNKLSDNQKYCLEKLVEKKWKAVACYTFEEAQKIIDDYLK